MLAVRLLGSVTARSVELRLTRSLGAGTAGSAGVQPGGGGAGALPARRVVALGAVGGLAPLHPRLPTPPDPWPRSSPPGQGGRRLPRFRTV